MARPESFTRSRHQDRRRKRDYRNGTILRCRPSTPTFGALTRRRVLDRPRGQIGGWPELRGRVGEIEPDVDGHELEVLRAGVRLMALRAFGDADLADEVAQETIVRAFHALRSSRPEILGPFVAGIARHVITDIIRAKQRDVPLEDLSPESEPQTSGDPLFLLCEAGEHARVRQALELLTKDDRDLLRLSFFEGLSSSEIAKRIGAPPERIRQRRHRALARLREAFDRPSEAAPVRHGLPGGATLDTAVGSTADKVRSSK